MERDKPIMGVVVTRNCPTCGHHEIGIETKDGRFQALRPGDIVSLLNDYQSDMISRIGNRIPEPGIRHDAEDFSDFQAWAPLPVLGNRMLRCKYGVLIPKELAQEKISAGLYEMTYKQKLQRLIEREEFTPLPVILDRFFMTPQLASGDAKQISDALWNEIEEIRNPALFVQGWLEHENEENLAKMIHPLTAPDLQKDETNEEDLKKELCTITLEDFFEML